MRNFKKVRQIEGDSASARLFPFLKYFAKSLSTFVFFRFLMNQFSPVVLSICGATCSGKSTLANLLQKTLNNCYTFNQDDFYRPESFTGHHVISDLNHINWELESSVDNEKLAKVIEEKISQLNNSHASRASTNYSYDHFRHVMRVLDEHSKSSSEDLSELLPACRKIIEELPLPPLVIVEGITILNNSSLRNLSDLNVFISLDYETCLQRRLLRDYDPPDPPSYFQKVVWPCYETNKKEVFDKCPSTIVELNGVEPIGRNFVSLLQLTLEKVSKQQQ